MTVRGGLHRYNFIHGLSISMRGSVGFTRLRLRRSPEKARVPLIEILNYLQIQNYS